MERAKRVTIRSNFHGENIIANKAIGCILKCLYASYSLLVAGAFIVYAFENMSSKHINSATGSFHISSMSLSSLESSPTGKGKIPVAGHVREGVGKLGSLCKGSRRIFKGRMRGNKVSRVGETHLIILSRREGDCRIISRPCVSLSFPSSLPPFSFTESRSVYHSEDVFNI